MRGRIRLFLKSCWRRSPDWMRRLTLEALGWLCMPKKRTPHPAGPLYVCGAFSSMSGLGQGARMYAAHARAQGRDVVEIDVSAVMWLEKEMGVDTQGRLSKKMNTPAGPGTVVIHANPPQFFLVLAALGRRFLEQKRLAAYWAWELEALPAIWKAAMKQVDEIETPSSFVAATMKKYTSKPVRVSPHPVSAPFPGERGVKREHLSSSPGQAPENARQQRRLRCLFIFDAASGWERKNPEGALAAFARAFSPSEGSLTIKISHPQAAKASFAALARLCRAHPHVSLITAPLSQASLDALFNQHDIYLSLHRSEGYGLTIHEAMVRGLHAVATGWSGNMDFMTGPLAHPVGYRLVPCRLRHGPYAHLRARWAEPDVDHAARILRSVRQGLGCA